MGTRGQWQLTDLMHVPQMMLQSEGPMSLCDGVEPAENHNSPGSGDEEEVSG